jgi:hypothetical protein
MTHIPQGILGDETELADDPQPFPALLQVLEEVEAGVTPHPVTPVRPTSATGRTPRPFAYD